MKYFDEGPKYLPKKVWAKLLKSAIAQDAVDKSGSPPDMCSNNMAKTQAKTVIVGFYDVPGYGLDSVETEVVGKPKQQYARLDTLIQLRHPATKTVVAMRRIGSVIEQRDGTDGFIEVPPGATIGQLFANQDTGEAELSRTIGRVFMFGSPHDIVLVFLRAQGYVQVRLTPLLKGAGNGTTTYSNRLDPQRLADELPALVKAVLGADARALTLKLREVNPKLPIA